MGSRRAEDRAEREGCVSVEENRKITCMRPCIRHNLLLLEQRKQSMQAAYFDDLIYIAAFGLGGLVFALGPFVVVHLLSARRTRNYANKTGQFIECGMDPIGDAWIRYSAVYYLYALVFVAFAVDVLFLIPVALVYDRQFAVRDLVELVMFVGILSLVIVYAWKKGVFEWKQKRPAPKTAQKSSSSPS